MSGENQAASTSRDGTENRNEPTFNNQGNNNNIRNINISKFVTNTGTAARPPFDEEAFTKYLKELKISFVTMCGEEKLATLDMLRNTPAVLKTSFKERMRTIGAKRCTDLYDLFPNGIPIKNVIGIVGEPGSGKSVLLKLMQLQFIESGHFPFLIPVKNLKGEGENKFALFVRDHGYADCHIKDEDLESFGDWLTNNQHRIVYLFDALDEASINLSADVGAVNVHGSASPQTWMGSLFQSAIMKDSMVVFTTRPASVFKLPQSQRPSLVYTLDGFESESMESVVNIYNKDYSDEIVALINSKASKENSFLRSPFAIALIASTYKESSSGSIIGSSLTALYKNAFDERQVSVHNRRPNIETKEEYKRVQDLVDDFFHTRFKANQLHAFSVADLNDFGLSITHVESHSFVKMFFQRNRHLIGDEEKMVEPSHVSVHEYHCARALLKCKNMDEFKEAVNELFVLDDQDRKTLTRRFLSGLISCPDSNAEKREVFLKKLLSELMDFISGDVSVKYAGDQLIQAMRRQAHLLNDLAELPNEVMNDVRNKFSAASNLRVRVQLQDASLLNAITKFICKFDPKLRLLQVTMHDDVQADELSKFVNAAVNLSRKVTNIRVYNIDESLLEFNDIQRIMQHTTKTLELFFTYAISTSRKNQLEGQIGFVHKSLTPGLYDSILDSILDSQFDSILVSTIRVIYNSRIPTASSSFHLPAVLHLNKVHLFHLPAVLHHNASAYSVE